IPRLVRIRMPKRPTPDPDGVITTTVRVRYAEVDQMKVAYYANYLVWFEVGRGAFCRERGIDYAQMESEGLFLPVLDVHIRYHPFARYDDELKIAIHLEEITRRTLKFAYRITCEDRLVAEGHTTQMLVDASGKPRTFTPDVSRLLAGSSMDIGPEN